MAKILVVDDETPLRTAVSRFLERAGHEVAQARNGLEGVDAYCEGSFDLVLMDIVMPVMGGLEAIGRIRSEFPDANILAQSAGWLETAVDPLVIARDLGADATIDKPYELADLLTAVNGQLERGPRQAEEGE